MRPFQERTTRLRARWFSQHSRGLPTGLDWVVAADADSAEIALHGQPGDVLIYPTNGVAKRWVAHETGFLPGFAAEMVDAVVQLRSNSA